MKRLVSLLLMALLVLSMLSCTADIGIAPPADEDELTQEPTWKPGMEIKEGGGEGGGSSGPPPSDD